MKITKKTRGKGYIKRQAAIKWHPAEMEWLKDQARLSRVDASKFVRGKALKGIPSDFISKWEEKTENQSKTKEDALSDEK